MIFPPCIHFAQHQYVALPAASVVTRSLISSRYVLLIVQVYEITSGSLLCSILLDFGLTCVTMDRAEKWLFVGASSGKILQVNLQSKVIYSLKYSFQLGTGTDCASQSSEIDLAEV
jgi:hypothetical protein